VGLPGSGLPPTWKETPGSVEWRPGTSVLRVRIGGADAAIAFAGLISPGVYQFNVVVPAVPDGDRTIVAELRGLLTRADLMLTCSTNSARSKTPSKMFSGYRGKLRGSWAL